METVATKIVELLMQELVNRVDEFITARLDAERDLALQRHVAAQNVVEDKCASMVMLLEGRIMDQLNTTQIVIEEQIIGLGAQLHERVLAILDTREASRKIEDKIDLVIGERVESTIGNVNWEDNDDLRQALPEMLNGLTFSMTINYIE